MNCVEHKYFTALIVRRKSSLLLQMGLLAATFSASPGFARADATVDGFFREDLVSSGFFEGHQKHIVPAADGQPGTSSQNSGAAYVSGANSLDTPAGLKQDNPSRNDREQTPPRPRLPSNEWDASGAVPPVRR